ncbi:antitoxin [Herbiconiux sp. KACC 21604]|uniref:type II toxin-antitoxin system VapB family antitoxin n=1 Tax=unclassified Herbiconiux TaxID=2618217 RepID=UPI0014924B92|nr:antitoxin [Herbiconiux sp. SALV-R1]QJU53597.1 antitoxin [Herbiconiux sp. SALV-R1]WPO88577.1 antitoxin [Herbiconiux sp. KACC 21604]
MSDLLIRDVPDDVVADIDAQAAVLGLSRAEYVRRQLISEARRVKSTVTVDDLVRSEKLFSGLLDDDLMNDAWR